MEEEKEKQQYLFEEIIKKNYDPEQFQEFLVNAREDGDDLEKWSTAELKNIVAKFQQMFNKETQNSKDRDQQRKIEQQRQTLSKKELINQYADIEQPDRNTSKSKQEEQEFAFNYSSNQESYRREVKCSQSAPNTLLTAKNLQVRITKFQKKDGGIFQQSYVSYFIQTPIFSQKLVERRYTDFVWLKETLEWLHPGIPIPPIAKKGQFRRYDDKHLRKRMMILEMFLSKLLQIEELRAQKVVEDFLKLDDKASFEKFKANYKKNKKPIPLRQINNSKGNLTLGIDEKINGFLSATQRHFNEVQPVIKSLYKDFKGVATALEQCGEILKGIGSNCEILDVVERRFRKDQQLSYCPNNFYTIVSQAVNRFAEQLLNQALIFRTQTYSLIKYESLYMLNITDGFQDLSNIQENFLETKRALGRKKEKLFLQGNVQKWELEQKIDRSNKSEAIAAMLPRQTKKLGNIRDIYALYNYQMYTELQRYFATKNVQLGTRLQRLCKNETRLCSEMMMLWVDAETNIMGMRENKSVVKC